MPESSDSAGGDQLDVVFVAPHIGPLLSGPDDAWTGEHAGGAETQISLIARALAERGAVVGVIADETSAPLPEEVNGFRILARPRAKMHSGVVALLLRPVRALTSLWSALLVDSSVFVQRSAGIYTGLVALAARARRRRFVYSSSSVSDFDFARLERRRWNVWLFELGVRLADEVVVQTPEQVRLCVEHFGREPVLIKSIAEPAERRRERPEAFLWVGRLASYKQPLAYVELARALPEAQFWMIAVPGGPDSEALAAELERAGRELPNLELLAPRPRAELVPLIERAVAMVNTAEYEGMPNVFLEGWSRGVPALALTHDPDGVIARERLGAFAEGSPTRMIDQAATLWQQRRDQDDLAQRCQDYIDREHSPQQAADRWTHALRLTLRTEPERGD